MRVLSFLVYEVPTRTCLCGMLELALRRANTNLKKGACCVHFPLSGTALLLLGARAVIASRFLSEGRRERGREGVRERASERGWEGGSRDGRGREGERRLCAMRASVYACLNVLNSN
eukprot:5485597-Pleurochrysis_carterae.AAC.1